MSAVDGMKRQRTALRWARVNPDLPGGLHQPKRAGDVGWDLEAMEDRWIEPMGICDVPTNCRIELPDGYWAEIRARSSFATRNMTVEAGTIDTGFRGQLFVLIRNLELPQSATGEEVYTKKIAAGERIGQLVFHQVAPLWAVEAEYIDMTTDRGENGFGSTGR